VEAGETCDPCPPSCDDGASCTSDITSGKAETCDLTCKHEIITQCAKNDGCCPAGCNFNSDSDCTATCGNRTVDAKETCDPPASCPTECDDGNSCTTDSLTGSAANCNVECVYETITRCGLDDQCCPAGCNANNDHDCASICGNDVVESGETCDPCPPTCGDDDNDPCTKYVSSGNAENCGLVCTSKTITTCDSAESDGCCPTTCNGNTDIDCSKTCGNGVVESGETCDPPASCPITCNDGVACTENRLSGSAANCNVACSYSPITQCIDDDGCCLQNSCTIANDSNCPPRCGDGVVTTKIGETCDPCVCPSNSGCATYVVTSGSAATCDMVCTLTPITSCDDQKADGCCPTECDGSNDLDCARCGDGIVTTAIGETCDTAIAAGVTGACPTTCDDGNVCTTDKIIYTNGNPCTAACTNTALGNNSPCTTDNVPCTNDVCRNGVCSHINITQCSQVRDGCCPDSECHKRDPDCRPSNP
jgi:hypothetical protein